MKVKILNAAARLGLPADMAHRVALEQPPLLHRKAECMRKSRNVSIHGTTRALEFPRRNQVASLPVFTCLSAGERFGRELVTRPRNAVRRYVCERKPGKLPRPPSELAFARQALLRLVFAEHCLDVVLRERIK